MRVKLALLDNDPSYMNRLVSTFNSKYSDKLEIYSFTNMDVALDTLEESKIDVLIANDSFDIDLDRLSRRCAFAYLVETAGIEDIKECRAIFKYQKADLIYKEILNIFSEKALDISGVKMSDSSCKMILFASPCGGVGNSTIAASYALNRVKAGARTLYLNLETFGSSDLYFTAEGQFGMSDIIYALKSQKANLHLKLESCVRQDSRGVYFFSKPKLALDMIELKLSEVEMLLLELKNSGLYDYVVVDTQFKLGGEYLSLYNIADGIVMVTDGTKTSNSKLTGALEAVSTMLQGMETTIAAHIFAVYNKFQKGGEVLPDNIIKNIGGVSLYQNNDVQQIINNIANMMFFENIG